MEDKNYEELEERVRALEQKLAKYQGFIGAIIFVGSCLWAAGIFVVEHLFKK